jgi:hypothetical protein
MFLKWLFTGGDSSQPDLAAEAAQQTAQALQLCRDQELAQHAGNFTTSNFFLF